MYPIYYVTQAWQQDIKGDYKPGDYATRGIPKGRMRNSTGGHRMFRESQRTTDIIADCYEKWWPEYLKGEHAPNGSDLIVKVTFSHHETWCPSWFCHWTFDNEQSDAETLDSFQQYVDRMIRFNSEHGYLRKYTGDDGKEYSHWVEKVCLMGAEDRWRWHGSTTGEQGDQSRTPPPCRCTGCKKSGLIRIIH